MTSYSGRLTSLPVHTTDSSSIAFYDLKSEIFYLFRIYTIPTYTVLISDSVVRSKNSVTRSKNFLHTREYDELEVENLFEGKISLI